MSGLDRTLRLILAVLITGMALGTDYLMGDWLLMGLALSFSAINLFAVFTGICVMYLVTGTDTRRTRAS